MDRNSALKLLKKHVKNQNTIKHSLASEAVLRALARRLGENEDEWGLAGLLHDVDYEISEGNPSIHGIMCTNILKENSVDKEIIDAINAHNEMASNAPCRNTKFHYALAAGETITGLITATALVYPDKKLASVKTKSITKRMKEKAFAASVNRDVIMECEKLGLTIDEFAKTALEAMQSISTDLGL
ncbi:MAG: HDIG domain-containing protein [Proteobacteria bacterium]|nr:HDIG domain-containing protein [Pseudomonadota bacterium]